MNNNVKNLSNTKNNIHTDRENLVDKLFKEAINLLEDFSKTKNLDTLKIAADTLSNIIQYDDEHVGAYISSSYIFYVLENNELALNYLEIAEKLSPSIKNKLADFKSKLFEKNKNINMTYSSPKVVVSKNSNFWNTMKKLF